MFEQSVLVDCPLRARVELNKKVADSAGDASGNIQCGEILPAASSFSTHPFTHLPQNNQDNLKLAFECITLGLAHYGIGGKTSSGMGYMTPETLAVPELRTATEPMTEKNVLASVFLSHTGAQKPFARSLHDELWKLGVVAWLDERQLSVGRSISQSLTEAIQSQTALTFVLSREFLESTWYSDELRDALDSFPNKHDRILPILYGLNEKEALKFIQKDKLLKRFMLHPDGQRVDAICIQVKPDDSEAASQSATEIAKKLYELTTVSNASELTIAIDQRGDGPKAAPPNLPDLARGPTLIYRFDHEERTRKLCLDSDNWSQAQKTIRTSLGQALGTRGRKRIVHIGGDAQLGLFFVLGRFFLRREESLVTYGFREGESLSSEGWKSDIADMASNNPTQPQFVDNKVPGSRPAHLALVICKESVQRDAIEDAQACRRESVIFPHENDIQSPEQIVDILVGVQNYLQNVRPRNLYIYTSLPKQAVTLLGSHFPKFGYEKLSFCEYNRDDGYTALAIDE